MRYQIVITRQFEKDFKEVKKEVREPILNKIKKLRKHPYLKFKKLSATLTGKYSLWVGDHRIVCSIIDKPKKEIILYSVGHRKEIYERI